MAASRVVHVTSSDDGVAAHELREGIARIQEELQVTPEFPAEVVAAAEAAVAAPRLPDLDRTDLPLVTIDPPTSMDLDQAMHLVRDGDGYVVYYAIADLAAFITPGDPIDVEAHKRGQTLYGADSKVPLHPTLDLGGRRLAAARPGLSGAAVDDQGRRDRRGHRRDGRAGPGQVHGQARLRRRPAGDRRRLGRRVADAAQGGRRAAAGPRGSPRRGVAAAAGAGGLDRGRPLEPGVPGAAADRAVERPDLAAHGHGRRLADGLRAGRPAAHAAAGRPARRAAPPPHRAGAGHRLAGRDALPRLHPVARPEPADPRRDGHGVHAAAARQRVRRVRRRGCPTSRSTPRWRRSTPT